MGAMIEQIWVGRTSQGLRACKLVFKIWTWPADHHLGPRFL